MPRCFRPFVAALLLLTAHAAALEMPAIFSDDMVLQRDLPVPVWGQAEPGRHISVGFADGERIDTRADEAGHWRVELPPMPANAEGAILAVFSREQPPTEPYRDGEGKIHLLEFKNVLVGEVWQCSGQSNMAWRVRQSANPEAEIAAADHPRIRMFTMARNASPEPQFAGEGRWQVCSPETVGEFSAVGYYFGRTLQQELDVPIGLVVTPWGGAAAEAFTSLESLNDLPAGRDFIHAYEAERKKTVPEGEEPSRRLRPNQRPGQLFNGLIRPAAPFAQRGVIWYQGESNTGRAEGYDALMKTLIDDWRDLWDQPGDARTFPFLTVQLANFHDPVAQPGDHGWARLRDAQLTTAHTHPQTYLATAVDIGEADDIHPKNKQEVGRRLALIALRQVYGDDSIVDQGPLLESAEPAGGDAPRTMRLSFTYAEGLQTKDGQAPRGFAVKAPDGEAWQWAESAAIDGPQVLVTAPEGIEAPFEVRYGWAVNPTDGPHGINLVNGAGLPMFPFEHRLD
jgi:sialate O-acetylesterase